MLGAKHQYRHVIVDRDGENPDGRVPVGVARCKAKLKDNVVFVALASVLFTHELLEHRL